MDHDRNYLSEAEFLFADYEALSEAEKEEIQKSIKAIDEECRAKSKLSEVPDETISNDGTA